MKTFDDLRDSIQGSLHQLGTQVLGTDAPELVEWAAEISIDAALALEQQNDQVLDELGDQAVLLLEMKRGQIADSVRGQIRAIVTGAITTARNFLVGGLLDLLPPAPSS